ncbi:MAG TPA: mitofilin family membrane protein [Stellaceae bacterium]|nr:mitofilin family membrane protein [Stellaceae bacterium]
MSERGGESEPAGTSPAGGPTVIDVTPTPSPEPEHPADAQPKARRGGAAIAALATVVLALATSPYWAPPVASVLPWGGTPEAKPAAADTTAMDAKLSALETRLADLAQAQQRAAALDQRVAQLEQRPAPLPNPRDAQQAAQQAQALGALGDRLAALEQRIAAAASSQTAADATKSLQSEVQALSQKLDEQSQVLAKLQSQEASGTGRTDAAFVVTLGQLRSALATSRPYGAELQAAEALATDQPDILVELHKLDGRAQQGVPTLAVLTQRFPAIMRGAAQASAPAAPEEGWRARALAKLKSLVTVRRAGEPRGNETGSIEGGALADADTALQKGDLGAAAAAMRRADGTASPAGASWLEDAQARLDAEAALAAADAALMKRFLGAPGAGAKP